MIFVTGGTGLLGTRLLYDLAINNEKIVALKRSQSDLKEVLNLFCFWDDQGTALFEKIEWRHGDIEDIFSLEDALQGCTHVYHTAAMVSFHKKDAKALQKVNISGTKNLVDICIEKGIQKLCMVSSTAAIGRVKSGDHIDETAEWEASDLNTRYAVSKYESELQVWRGQEEGLSTVIVNPSVIIGPGKRGQSSGALFTLVEKGLSFYPKGSNAYVHLNDVSKACIQLMNSEIENERFLVAGSNMEFRKLLDQIADAMGKERPKYKAKKWMMRLAYWAQFWREIFTGKKADITKETVMSSGNSYSYDSSKIQERLDFEFTPIQKGVEEAVVYLNSERSAGQ